MKRSKRTTEKRKRRKLRVRKKIFGTPARPRLSLFRSNKNLYAQFIDDENGRTLAAASTRELKKRTTGGGKIAEAHALGALLADRAREKGITNAVFDRGRYAYHGRVKGVAEHLRKSGFHI